MTLKTEQTQLAQTQTNLAGVSSLPYAVTTRMMMALELQHEDF